MKTLIMDTSTKYLAIGIYEDDLVLSSIQDESVQRQSEEAIVKLQELLLDNELSLLDIDEFIVTVGPGSYTGQRVALTIAKTICLTSDIKLKTISTLLAMAGNSNSISIIDARSNKIYLGLVTEGKTEFEGIYSYEDAKKIIENHPTYQVIGDSYLLGIKSQVPNLIQNIFELKEDLNYVDNVKSITPNYIKEALV